jgi:hypothetical protein
MIPKGSKVNWKEDGREFQGMVQETYPEKVELSLEGRHESRHGSSNDQALFIELQNGNKTIRLESEVHQSRH